MTRRLSPLAYASTVLASIVAGGLFIWPLHIVLAAGQNAGLVMVAAGVAMTSAAAVARAQPVVTPIGRLLDSVAVGLLMVIDGLILVSLSTMLQTFYFPETPRWALTTIFLGVVIGWTVRRPNSAPIMAGFWVPLLVTGSVVIVGVGLTNLRFVRVLAPLPAISLDPIAHGLIVMAYIILPIPVTLRRYSPERQGVPSVRARLLPVLVAWGLLGLLYAIVVGTLGISAVTHLRWPLVFTLDQVTLDSAFFLSRIGILVIFAWTLGAAVGILVHLDLLIGAPDASPPATWRALVIGIVWGIAAMAIPSPAWATWHLIHWVDGVVACYLTVDAVYSLAIRPRRRRQPPRLASDRGARRS